MKHTPLFDAHMQTATNVINLKGVARPVEYVGHVEEHRAIRERASLCDVWHLGEIEIEGKDALALVQKLITNDATRLSVNQGLYTVMCNERGHIIDDLVCFRLAPDRFLWVVNVPKIDEDFQWIMRHAQGLEVSVRNLSSELALIALQGPYSAEVLQRVTRADLSKMRYYWCEQTMISVGTMDVPCIVSRTGYTGERGYEICVSCDLARFVWERLLLVGRPLGAIPHGVAARESTRTQAGYLLNGNDMDGRTNPYEVGLGWVVKPEKDFIGKEALRRVLAAGVERKLVGLEVGAVHALRYGQPIYKSGKEIGRVTSGPLSPRLLNREASCGLGFVAAAHSSIGTELEIAVHGARIRARIVALPFYRLRVKDEERVATYSPYELQFTVSHAWLKKASDGLCTVGMTDFCQRDLGEILFIALASVGERVSKGAVLARIDTYRKAFAVVSPVSGEVVDVNSALSARPDDVNRFPYAHAGLVTLKPAHDADYEDCFSYQEYRLLESELRRYENWSRETRTT